MWMRTAGVRTRSNLYEDCVSHLSVTVKKKKTWDEQLIKIESLFGHLTFFRSFALGLCQGNTMKGKVRMVEAAREKKRRNKGLTIFHTPFIPRFPVDPHDLEVPPPSNRATQGTKPLRAGQNSQGGFWYWKRYSNLHLLCLKHTLPSELSTRF